MLITKFYENQDVFITGGTGFIGKALLEKLLRSCPTVGKIFLLIRSKKHKSANERLLELLKTKTFDQVRLEQPQAMRKVIAIDGNCTELGLGISKEDLQTMKNVSIIFNSAASVRFDDPLRYAVLLNTRGTYELVKLAETLPNLKAFVQVSTMYSNPDKRTVDEKVYAPYADWRTTIKIAETYDTDILDILNLKYSNHQPNTYTFSKSLSEQIVNEFRHKLPIILFRPSIVISSINEPVPGWLDNYNGPIGLLVACGVGILRTNYGFPDTVSDIVPIDIVIRSLIVAAYAKGMETQESISHSDDQPLQVYNCAISNISEISIGRLIEIGKTHIKKNPFEKTLWVPNGCVTRCRFWNYWRLMTTQLFFAIILDWVFTFNKKKPMFMKLQRRIYAANMATFYFVTNTWIFNNENFLALEELVSKSEKDKFAFRELCNLDFVDLIKKGIRGAKEFLLNEPPESTRGALVRMRIYQAVELLIKIILVTFLLRSAVRYIYPI